MMYKRDGDQLNRHKFQKLLQKTDDDGF